MGNSVCIFKANVKHFKMLRQGSEPVSVTVKAGSLSELVSAGGSVCMGPKQARASVCFGQRRPSTCLQMVL